MIKMIAVDMDGTLLNEERELSPKVVDAIKKAQAAGVRMVIATGRGYKSAIEVLHKYDITWDYIFASGSEIRNQAEEVVKRVAIGFDRVKQLEDLAKKRHDAIIHFFGADRDYAVGTEQEIIDASCREMSSFSGISMEEVRKMPEFQKVPDTMVQLDSIEEIKDKDIIKAFIFSDDIDMLRELNEEIMQIPNLASASSFPTNLEITDIEAQKGVALKELAEQFAIPLSEVMAMGDSLNDESMLSLPLGAAVAMGNAHESLKRIAPYVTKTNDEDGVAYAIEKALEDNLEALANPDYIGA